MVIRQGEVFWLDMGEPAGSEPGFSRPAIVVSNDIFNASKIKTAVVCILTSNLKRAEAPGNVRLENKEANLPKPSVVNISQIYTVNKTELTQRIGKVSKSRVKQIIKGLSLLFEAKELP